MSKNKKNSNYVTPKTEEAKARKLQQAKKRKTKKIVKVIAIAFLVIAVIVGIVLGIGLGLGLFEYTTEATYHASIEIKDYGTLHVELYGKEAPKTVENFIKLASAGYYNGKTFHKLVNDLIYGGSLYSGSAELGIKGEFSDNGVENKISHVRGTLSMARNEANDTAYGQFFIVRKTDRSLDGKYAAFGRITDGMDIVDKMFKDAKLNATGGIAAEDRFVITSVTTHSSHSH
ncbi:MAG: peptidylprolyl isomerase [Clostridia bacterium]|nr:peptidylprolyl isomerase [Clostridia bacterium]